MQIIQDVEAPEPFFGKYAELVAVIRASEDWVKVPLADVSGTTNRSKQSTITQALTYAKLLIQTRIPKWSDCLFIRRRPVPLATTSTIVAEG